MAAAFGTNRPAEFGARSSRNIPYGARATVKTWAALVAAVAISFAADGADVVFRASDPGALHHCARLAVAGVAHARTPTLIGLAITMTVTVAVMLAFGFVVVWGFGRVGRWLIVLRPLSGAVLLCGRLAENHGVLQPRAYGRSISRWPGVPRWAQQITGRVNNAQFPADHLVDVILGLMEVETICAGRWRPSSGRTSGALSWRRPRTPHANSQYMVVRTQTSLATGALVGAFAWLTGRQFAAEWGVIAFALNYIPFIGPFVVMLFPTLLRWRNPPPAGGSGRIRLPQHHTVRHRQLRRAARVGQRAFDIAISLCCSPSFSVRSSWASMAPSSVCRSPSPR